MAGADDTSDAVSLGDANTSVDTSTGPMSELDGLDQDLEAGVEVGEYVIESKIGAGGFGAVYRATHPVIGKEAAVKVLARQFSSDPAMVSRFVSEARVVNTIRHNNIIDVFSFGTLDDGRRYFVMELLQGVPLDAYLRQTGPLDPKQVIAIMRGVAKALDAAHDKGVVHRDLKPDNIFLNFDDDGRPVPKLLDFGIAKLRGDVATTGHKTRTGTPIGTPHYMSPEQCLGGDDVDGRTDVYAFGVVCFEALTGKPPFDADSYLALMTKHTTADRPPVSKRRPDLSSRLDAPLKKIMALEPDDRPATVIAALELIAVAAGESLSSTTPSLPLPNADTSPSDLAVARTALDASSRVGPAPSSSRAPLLIGIVVIAGIGLYLATSGLGSEASPTPVNTNMAATSSSSPVAPAPSVTTPPSTQKATTPVVTKFAVTLKTPVKNAKAFLDERELGVLPGPFELSGQRGANVTLVVKAAGYFPEKVSVTLEPEQSVDVSLRRVPPKKLHDDIEPF